ncbi:hypothetical protein [Acetonema longum]|uniref:Resolvase RNase H domain protein n=1 Tax=Acetonema longum DSM 6540 TaxID=1009370 RepID=F7NLZ3_9FIRM|nr:hypothetical protein [Acetonema longum]EGO62919.1 resolvase RNase H domain protein [Acetonema longum DSM 6540]
MLQCVIGIDPGRDKCGLAVVDKEQGTVLLQVVPSVELGPAALAAAHTYHTRHIVLGNGTSHRQARERLETHQPPKPWIITIIDEAHTTEQARRRYWRENPPAGLRRLIPLGLQMPPEPVDGYVAVILAERYLTRIAKTD